MFTGTIIVALAVFGDLNPFGETHYPLQFFLTPFFVWAALRFGSREAATAILLASAVAWGTLRGSAPFAAGRGTNRSCCSRRSWASRRS